MSIHIPRVAADRKYRWAAPLLFARAHGFRERRSGIQSHVLRAWVLPKKRTNVNAWSGYQRPNRMAVSAARGKVGSMTKILIVDDEPDIRHILRHIFEKAGFEITEAIHGAAALDRLNGELPDLVVTDLMMPVMDGNELVKALREDPRTAKIPILSLTGNPASVVGADLVLTKLPKHDDLLAAVASVLEGRSLVTDG